jgi:hypothetical protein
MENGKRKTEQVAKPPSRITTAVFEKMQAFAS